ncbi:hypothetical protein B0J11DRAFT_578445 [Dendryphion nanum]|uniref:Uncharacterized protein n=1 Tax=Dendryphion nanum TaxID=256645 RepID=A0A9P9DZZ6_9PLEO|nr:hypothetical protein B0J11DRAFT_578445 [Dendryphion nanum]
MVATRKTHLRRTQSPYSTETRSIKPRARRQLSGDTHIKEEEEEEEEEASDLNVVSVPSRTNSPELSFESSPSPMDHGPQNDHQTDELKQFKAGLEKLRSQGQLRYLQEPQTLEALNRIVDDGLKKAECGLKSFDILFQDIKKDVHQLHHQQRGQPVILADTEALHQPLQTDTSSLPRLPELSHLTSPLDFGPLYLLPPSVIVVDKAGVQWPVDPRMKDRRFFDKNGYQYLHTIIDPPWQQVDNASENIR